MESSNSVNQNKKSDIYRYYNDYVTCRMHIPLCFGLKKFGATCWFGALMQMLISLPALNDTILEIEHLLNNKCAKEYAKFIKCIEHNEHHTFDPTQYKKLFDTFVAMNKGMFETSRHEDAAESFMTFINTINCAQVTNLFKVNYRRVIKCDICAGGSTNNTLINATNIIETTLPYDIQVAFRTNIELNTNELFMGWLKAHPCNFDVYKAPCGHIIPNYNTIEKLIHLSTIIIIIFDDKFQYITRWFPQEMYFPSIGGTYLVYKLVSKVEHFGMTWQGGHFVTHALRNGSWYLFDDDREVTAGNPNPTRDTFMIAYHMSEQISKDEYQLRHGIVRKILAPDKPRLNITRQTK